MSQDDNILSKKHSDDERNFKSNEELKEHFISRLKERYDISLSDDEYNDIHTPLGFPNSKVLEGNAIHWIKISSNNSAFIIKIKGKFVFTIYSRRRGRFITALPWESYNDETRFVPKILKKLNLKELAIEKYNEILSLCAKEFVDLGSSKENWYHYKNKCLYSTLLMLEYNGKLTMGNIYNQVVREILKTEEDE